MALDGFTEKLIGLKILTNRQFWQPPTILHIVYILAGRQLDQDSTSQCPSLSISKSKTARWLGIDSKKKLTELGVGISP
jgi:hypothetical protein